MQKNCAKNKYLPGPATVRSSVLQAQARGLVSGVDVMITIFCDFCQFSVKKLAFFSKTNVMIQFLHNLALF
jgi:hypothetical protein